MVMIMHHFNGNIWILRKPLFVFFFLEKILPFLILKRNEDILKLAEFATGTMNLEQFEMIWKATMEVVAGVKEAALLPVHLKSLLGKVHHLKKNML